ncbi:MAG TPA: hypothetical protein GX699_06605 [Firmicutes bacterium]|nr:hypothetical protein [Bacillota bacterium]
MELLVLVLNQPEHLDAILEGFLQAGLSGATVLESTGMGRTLCDKVPVFGGLRNLIRGCRPDNVTVFTVIGSVEKRQKAVKVIEDILGDLDRPNTGLYFTVPVSMVRGLAEPLTE